MLRKFIYFIILNSSLSSCNFFGVLDEHTMEAVTHPIEKQKLIGKWKADSHSYTFLKNDKTDKKMEVEIYESGKILFKNFIFPKNCYANKDSVYTKKDFSGIWKIKQNRFNNNFILNVTFNNDPKTVFCSNLSFDLMVLKKENNKIALFLWADDPDLGHRFLFKKME